ncbi:PucR family transcriptional regulator [Treponema sp.]|uniref:PucR family transcriptional regulator n=1 Tax=Treponema sp. TaxID=166 RepID=UPI0025DE0A34|nr:PucR family transcriptional regulator [Treponema sp.]MCR5217550.1 PucR family transcriptional regulator ligand-binding domain-containing protein [Treponema sp.]
MITVKEILNLTLFKKFKILTGSEYLTNTVTTVVILEYESMKIEYSGYSYGYFVLASYFFASSLPDLVHESLKILISRHVSGIAIKMSHGDKLPEEIIELANKEKVPLLVFYEEFMEDLIININESLKTRAQFIIQEEKLNDILNNVSDSKDVPKIAREINSNFKNKILCAYLISKSPSANLQVHTFFDRLMLNSLQHPEESPSWSFVKNGHNLILICSFNPEEIKELNFLTYIKYVLQKNGIKEDMFYTGYDTAAEDLENLRAAVTKARIASQVCLIKGEKIFPYNMTGVSKYIVALSENEIIRNEIKKIMSPLEEYDFNHGGTLIKTLLSYVKNNMDYIKTSNECFQHMNTIRYRIRKSMELLNLKGDESNEELNLLMRCYHLINTLSEERE